MIQAGTRGEGWSLALSKAVPRALPVSSAEVPPGPGIYIWFRDDNPIYVGEACGARGLRGRLRAHLAQGADLSHSTFRASVAVRQLGLQRSVVRQRPSVINPEQIAAVNQWVSSCEIGWIECQTPDEAHELEVSLRTEWRPPLNLV